MNIKPPPLPVGGTIGIIAPSSPAKRKTLKNGIEYLQSKGYKIKLSKYLTKGKCNIAGPDDHTRARYLEEFMIDDKIDCLICARGGYGALRILDKINYDRLKNAKPKPLIGYSDVTALQLAMLNKLNWISFSGPMVSTDLSGDIDSYTEQWFWRMLTEDKFPIEIQNPDDMKLSVINHGEAEGFLLPVCLSVFVSILNTENCPPLENSILCIEDINEKGYKLDRLFQILKYQSVFDKINGIILGQFTNCFSKATMKLEDIIKEAITSPRFPIITGLAYGHSKKKVTLPVGMGVKIQTDPVKIMILNS